MTTIELADLVIKKLINKSKFKFIALDDVSVFLKEKLQDEYSSEIGIAVKNELKNTDTLDFYREGDYYHEDKYFYCTGNWLAIKDTYKNPVEAKRKLGLEAWQLNDDEIDFSKF